jgi:hypothetical protein
MLIPHPLRFNTKCFSLIVLNQVFVLSSIRLVWMFPFSRKPLIWSENCSEIEISVSLELQVFFEEDVPRPDHSLPGRNVDPVDVVAYKADQIANTAARIELVLPKHSKLDTSMATGESSHYLEES